MSLNPQRKEDFIMKSQKQYLIQESDEILDLSEKEQKDKQLDQKWENLEQKLRIGPLEGYQKFGILPWKLLLHIFLVFLTAFQSNFFVSDRYLNNNNQFEQWQYILFGDLSDNGIHNLYSIQNVQDQFLTMFGNLQDPNDDIEALSLKNAEAQLIVKYRFPLYYQGQQSWEYPIDILEGIKKPFDMKNITQIKIFLQEVDYFQVNFKYINLITQKNQTTCWNIEVSYDLVKFTFLQSQLYSIGYVCGEKPGQDIKKDNLHFQSLSQIMILTYLILLVSGLSIFLQIKFIYEVMQVYMYNQQKNMVQKIKLSEELQNLKQGSFKKVQQQEKGVQEDELQIVARNLVSSQKSEVLDQQISGEEKNIFRKSIFSDNLLQEDHEEKLQQEKALQLKQSLYLKGIEAEKPWYDLNLGQKLSLINIWFIYILLGNLVQLVTQIFILVANYSDQLNFSAQNIRMMRWGVGIGCFFAWTSIVKYLEYNKRISLIMEVLSNAIPRIITEAVGFIPVLMSYIMIGMTCFPQSIFFSNIDQSVCTLFSLLLGDSIYDISTNLDSNSRTGFFGMIYVISFSLIFMLSVHNIWIAIIMDELKQKIQEIQLNKQKEKHEEQKKFKEKLKKQEKKKLQKIKSQDNNNLENEKKNLLQDALNENKIKKQLQSENSLKTQKTNSQEEKMENPDFQSEQQLTEFEQNQAIARKLQQMLDEEDEEEEQNVDKFQLPQFQKTPQNYNQQKINNDSEISSSNTFEQSLYSQQGNILSNEQLEEIQEEQEEDLEQSNIKKQQQQQFNLQMSGLVFSQQNLFQQQSGSEKNIFDQKQIAEQLQGSGPSEQPQQQRPQAMLLRKAKTQELDNQNQLQSNLNKQSIQNIQSPPQRRKSKLTLQSVARVIKNYNLQKQSQNLEGEPSRIMSDMNQIELRQIFQQELIKEQQIIQFQEQTQIKIHCILKEIKKKIETSSQEMLVYQSEMFGLKNEQKEQLYKFYRSKLKFNYQRLKIIEKQLEGEI